MFFKKKKNNLSSISYYIYEESRLKTEKLYSILKETSSWEIKNRTAFVVTSFIFHFFFYRIILLSKYEDSAIRNILKDCLYEMISHVTNEKSEANTLVDLCNDIFDNLDAITTTLSDCNDENEGQEIMQLQGKYFIANVDGIKPKEVLNSVAILIINTHFASLLHEGDSFLLNINRQ